MSTPSTAPPIIPRIISEELWQEAAWLPCVLSVDLPVKNFTVRDLLQLEKGSVLESEIANGADVPVLVNAHLVGWAEFEIVGRSLGVRMTGLA
jgi:flagellar motor switch/type III secretory pathway protein FliN